MADRITGQVFKVYDKKWPKGGTSYSVKLEDNPIYYRMGNDRHAGLVEPGKTISFEAEPVDEKSAKVTGAITEAKAQTASAATGSSGGTGTVRDNSIQYQSARKDALVYVQLVSALGAVKLPEKQAAKLKALDALLDQVTADFFNDIQTLGAVSRVNGVGEEAGEADEKTADTEE